jgi:hypothetical protein
MLRSVAVPVAAAIGAVCSLGAIQQSRPASPPPPDRALLDRYCVTCHNQKLLTAGLALDSLDIQNVGGSADRWEKVAAKLRSAAMPPPGRPRPAAAASEAFVTRLEAALDAHAATHSNPGRPVIHRLNRAEYTNAIRDLLALEIDGRSLLPADDSGYGFDNISDVLSLSPALLERYMIAAGKISQVAIGDPATRPVVQTYSVPPTLLQHDRMSEQLPFGTRGGAAISHYFPLDGEYVIAIRLQRTHANQIRGLGEPNDIELRLDRRRVKQFTVGGAGPRDPWSAVPSASPYEQTADDGLEIRTRIEAGVHVVAVAFPDRRGLAEGVLEPALSVATYEYAGDRDEPMGVATIEITGPYNAKAPDATPSRRAILVCRPERTARASEREGTCAKKILAGLARRAFRRPVGDDELARLMGFFTTGRQKGSFDAGIELALRAILVDPDFLFRVERDPPGLPSGSVFRVSDLELASRLSFFLWSSIPDEELLAAAERGRLSDPAVLLPQVKRMLADARSAALVSNFAGQWLHLRNVRGVKPDPDGFPEFDENLREALLRETELFFEHQLREDRPVTELLTADYTFVNERLARHYGMPGVYGSHFRRVALTDERRRGLLGHGSILMVTSYANRTSPTLRGKWVLENLLGAPPPAPPANVPSLNDEPSAADSSVRERLEQHRRNPTCASCHASMDPFGLALENFDAIGKWRTRDGQVPVDAVASLPDGTRVDGPNGVRNLLVGRRDRFAATVTEKLLTYALGRGVEYYDRPAIRKVLRDAAPAGWRWSSLIAGIVQSTPFQMRRIQP